MIPREDLFPIAKRGYVLIIPGSILHISDNSFPEYKNKHFQLYIILNFRCKQAQQAIESNRRIPDKQYILDVCNDFLIPAIKGNYPYDIVCIYSESERFNALVETADGHSFHIVINAGILKRISWAVETMNDQDIDEEIDDIAVQLLDNRELKHDVYECIADSAILFVVLHELSHILRKHLHYILPIQDENRKLHYNEMGPVRLSMESEGWEVIVKHSFLKLAEFDADAHSLILLYATSLELVAMISSRYEDQFPEWRSGPDNPAHRNNANLIMLYGGVIALTIIETQPDRSQEYPSPFARLLNLFDTFNQEVYKAHGIIDPDDPYTGLEYLKNDSRLQQVMTDYVFPNFLTALDIVNETCKVAGYAEKRGVHELLWLMDDFIMLLKTLTPTDLKTADAVEYRELRLCRPQFNALFHDFLSLSPSDRLA